MTNNPAARTFSSDFKRFFLRGLVVLLPSVLTLWILVTAYKFIDNNIADPINGWVKVGLIQVTARSEPLRRFFDPDPSTADGEMTWDEARAANIRAWWDERWYLDLIGLIIAIVAVYVAGRLLGGFFGRRIYRTLESFITALPVFKQVYPHVKQVVDFLFSDERPLKFNRVVVLEYPRKGVWSVGFLTGPTMKSIAEKSGDSVTVFIPSSPTPFTGYTVTVPREEVIEVPISVEEAIRFAVTGGVLIPEHQRIEMGATGDEPGGIKVLPMAGAKASKTPAAPEDKESRRDVG